MTLLAQWPWLNLADDVRFTFGALRTSEVAWPALEVFAHRPMANRVLMAGVDALTAGPIGLREKLIMAWGLVAVAAAAALLHRSLATRMTRLAAVGVALAVFASLAWASEPYVLQPEWTATVLGVAAFALAAWRTQAPAATRALLIAAAMVLAVAVLQKYTTVSVAGLLLVALWVLDRRRALVLAGLGALASVLLFGLTLAVGSHEWQWFRETPALNPDVGLRWDAFAEWAVNVGFNNPVLLAWPAAAALAAATTGRRSWVGASLVAFAGVLAVIVVQNQFFSYHGTPLLPVAAAVVAYAAITWWQHTGRPLLGLVPWAGWLVTCTVLLRLPAEVRSAIRTPVAWAMLIVIALIALLCWGQLRARRSAGSVGPTGSAQGRWLIASAVVTAAALTFPAWPATPYGLFGLDRSRRSEVVRQADLIREAEGVRAVVGNGPVAYLADGETVYMIDRPTPCRYPPAVVLYRSTLAGVGQLRSFAENLDCLREPSVRFLVLQRWRVPLDEVDPRISVVVAEQYDCDAGTEVGEVVVCPRR